MQKKRQIYIVSLITFFSLVFGCSSDPKIHEVKKLAYNANNVTFEYFVLTDFQKDSTIIKGIIEKHLKTKPISKNTVRTYLKEPDWYDNNSMYGEEDSYLKSEPNIPNSKDYLCKVSRHIEYDGLDTTIIKWKFHYSIYRK